MIKYRKITDISLTHRYDIDISKKRYLKCRYDTDTGDISTIFSIYRPTSSMYTRARVLAVIEQLCNLFGNYTGTLYAQLAGRTYRLGQKRCTKTEGVQKHLLKILININVVL